MMNRVHKLLLIVLLPLIVLFTPLLPAQYVGGKVCGGCHAAKFESQSKTGHAHALALGAAGSPGHWAFGAGEKATTWVSQTGEDTVVEHGLSYYAATKSMKLTPGHETPTDTIYRTFDPVGTALRCFRCHSTGPINLLAGNIIEPSELGVRCEDCHGPGAAHVKAQGAPGTIQNPKRLKAAELNQLCGACHRQASALDDDTDWGNAWNVRHQPSYLHRAACFRNSGGALSCLTCHNPHEPLIKTAASYDARCSGCHRNVSHKTPPGTRACVDCHMPQVTATQGLRFTNHWIGIYEQTGNKLTPTRRAVRVLQPAPVDAAVAPRFSIPADPSSLKPVYEKALSEREKALGPDHPRVARSASDLGMFLMQIKDLIAAEAPLRRAVAIDGSNADPLLGSDRENLASVLESNGKREEAFQLYRQAAAGPDFRVAARSFASLARLDSAHADSWYGNAVEAEEKASGTEDRRVAILLHERALALREKGDDKSAEPLLRRALAIQQKIAKPDYHLTAGILNTLGNLLEGAHQMEEAERLERVALRLSEERFGPESPELSMTCTNLADVLWNKHDYAGAARLYRRALAVDGALYGPDRPETAADIANLGMLLKEAGQGAAADTLLRQALTIYEKTLGPDSAQAGFVRQNLAARAP
jgi:tetratricopeptide (TPR) repeat protein/Zn finger protein HypA/HybF involved in hydrogenase expression